MGTSNAQRCAMWYVNSAGREINQAEDAKREARRLQQEIDTAERQRYDHKMVAVKRLMAAPHPAGGVKSMSLSDATHHASLDPEYRQYLAHIDYLRQRLQEKLDEVTLCLERAKNERAAAKVQKWIEKTEQEAVTV
jgi:hypothetical protein